MTATSATAMRPSYRIASIDWMRGFVMVLMVIDHASMAFDGQHVAKDSALYPDAATVALPAGEFLTRWITHLCAPTFVFLAGASLALSVERRVLRGVAAREIDRSILVFGQTAMFFYLVHRLVLEIPATYFDLRGVGNLATTYIVSALLLVLLYPVCRWYRTFKAAHQGSFLKYI